MSAVLATRVPAFEDDTGKAFSSLAARLAVAGYSLFRLADDSFLITRWNLSKPCPDLLAVAHFARLAGVWHG
jgi:hypothetical protein